MVSHGPTITHLLFADDSLLFFKADPNSSRNIKVCLDLYEKASEQVINYEKSALSFNPYTLRLNQDRVKHYLKIRESRRHELYLGAPSFSLKNKRMQFGCLKERMLKKVDTWNHKQFTKGGKEVLIKAVLQAIPTYAMSCFRIPTSICNELESICARFWRGSSGSKKGVHWKSWDQMCKRKEEDGMGFRKFGCFNQALIAKQIWRIICKLDSLVARIFKSRYFRNGDIMMTSLGSNPSFVWKSLCWGRELLREGLGWNVMNGQDIEANKRDWFGSWASSSKSTCNKENQKVAAYIGEERVWNEEAIRQDFLPF